MGSVPDAPQAEPPPHLRATVLRPPGPPGPGLGPNLGPNLGPPNLGPGPSAPRQQLSLWVLALAFLLSAGVGLGLTVLIGSLLV